MPATSIDANAITTNRTAAQLGAAVANGDASNGNSFTNDGRTVLLVTNAHATNPYNLTFAFGSATQVDGQAVTSRVVAIPANTGPYYFGPFSPQMYGTTMTVTVENASLKLSLVRLGNA